MYKALFLFCLALAGLIFFQHPHAMASGSITQDRSAAVILSYHRIGQDQYPDTNLRDIQFLAHIQEIINGGYSVLPLPDIITALQNKEELPPNTIAITFEGAYKSTLKSAIPDLLRNGIPFTVFYAADHASANSSQHMNWSDLRTLQRKKSVTLGLLPAHYTRLSGKSEEEIRRQLNKAKTLHREKFGREAKLFSYPFGEYSLAFKELIKSYGFTAAFGQNSGAASLSSDFFALPRFTMTEKYGDLERFRLVTRALPLPATDIEPLDPYLSTDELPTPGFTVTKELAGKLDQLSCFISGQSKPGLQIIGRRVEIRLSQDIEQERLRINCTMPGPKPASGEPERWRWLGMLLVRGKKEP